MGETVGSKKKKYFLGYKKPLLKLPDLLGPQKESFNWFMEEGMWEMFKSYSPISDYSGDKFELSFVSYSFDSPKYSEQHAKENMLTYDAPLKVMVKFKNKIQKTEKKQEILFGKVPIMTDRGTFIINGVERIIMSQLTRSFGVFFNAKDVKNVRCFSARITPSKGPWLEFETDINGTCSVRVDRTGKVYVSTFLRAFGLKTDDQILKATSNKDVRDMLKKTILKDSIETVDDACVEFYKKIRSGDQLTPENAKAKINDMFSKEQYDISELGRIRFNKRFGIKMTKGSIERRTISIEDVMTILGEIVRLNNDPKAQPDDIDNLSSRRVRYVGELFQLRIRRGIARLAKNTQDRMTTIDTSFTTPHFLNPQPFRSSVNEFFLTDQLSHVMKQENIVAEIEHRRTISALGPGGLTREHAGIAVRDLHPSHYGRICPVHTPEGPNIGLNLQLALYADVNRYGIIETTYAKVEDGVITKKVVSLNAEEEEKYRIAHRVVSCDKDGKILDKQVIIRKDSKPRFSSPKKIEYIDVSSNQTLSVAAALIPFIEHDAAHRALLGANTQKQATIYVSPEAPYVSTGIEGDVAKSSRRMIVAEEDGEITYVDAEEIKMKGVSGKNYHYHLIKFGRTNSPSIHHQRSIVSLKQKVKQGQILADAASTDQGQLALGQNLRVAFVCWHGMTYEDAILISSKIVEQGKFVSLHAKDFKVSVRDTKLGPEMTTFDIPNVSEAKLRNLDERGIVRIGAEVKPGDILVGKVTPKGETQLTPEERLLRSIFGERARDIKDSSEKLSPGHQGRVINVKVFNKENGDQLDPGVLEEIRVTIAQMRNITVGDKLTGRHGNKGVVARILPAEDMPHTEDGEPVDIVLSPLGIASRANVGQVFEAHLGLAAQALGYQAVVPSFSGATEEEVREELVKAGFDKTGKETLYDGRTGEKLARKVTVGNMYLMKISHMVEDKLHMRSFGNYAIVHQQPLQGRTREGGQRLGEMEVWAFLGYGAAYNLREMMTIKSDDMYGRSAAFKAMIDGDRIKQINLPESFNVLIHYLRGLGLNMTFNRENNDEEEEE